MTTAAFIGKVGQRLNFEFALMLHGVEARRAAAKDSLIVNNIKREGVHLTSLDQLELPLTGEMLTAAARLFNYMPDGPATHLGRYFALDTFARRVAYVKTAEIGPELFLWGLNDRLLDIAQAVLGVPPALIGADLRMDVKDGDRVGSRRWHLDGEDRRVVKICVYLTDVTVRSQVFEYVTRSHTGGIKPRTYSDEEMSAIVSKDLWKRCYGPRGTVLIAETSSFYHHGKAPDLGGEDRLAVWYAYTSRNPKNRQDCINHFSKDALATLQHRLTKRQRDCALWY